MSINNYSPILEIQTFAVNGIIQANPNILIIGQSTTSNGEKILIENVKQAEDLFGADQHITKALRAGFAFLDWSGNKENKPNIYAYSLPDNIDGSGVTSSVAITFTACSVSQELNFVIDYALSGIIEDNIYKVPLIAGDSATSVATKIASAINGNLYSSVVAAASLGVLTLTAKNKGIQGNTIKFKIFKLRNITGLVITLGANAIAVEGIFLTGGAGTITSQQGTKIVLAMGTQKFNFIVDDYKSSHIRIEMLRRNNIIQNNNLFGDIIYKYTGNQTVAQVSTENADYIVNQDFGVVQPSDIRRWVSSTIVHGSIQAIMQSLLLVDNSNLSKLAQPDDNKIRSGSSTAFATSYEELNYGFFVVSNETSMEYSENELQTLQNVNNYITPCVPRVNNSVLACQMIKPSLNTSVVLYQRQENKQRISMGRDALARVISVEGKGLTSNITNGSLFISFQGLFDDLVKNFIIEDIKQDSTRQDLREEFATFWNQQLRLVGTVVTIGVAFSISKDITKFIIINRIS